MVMLAVLTQSIPTHIIPEREDFTMSNAKHAPKRKRGAKAVPVLGAAGLLSLAGGASAATSAAPVADLPPQTTTPNHEIILGEEELSDVSLSTFYVFDKESAKSQLGDKVAWRGCGGCRCGWGGCRCGRCGCGWRGWVAVAAVAVATAGHGGVAASAKGHTT